MSQKFWHVMCASVLLVAVSARAQTTDLPVTDGLQFHVVSTDVDGAGDGVTGDPAEGADVSTWVDKSGNGLDLLPGADAPTMNNSVVRFDGDDDVMNFSGNATINNVGTIVIVLSEDTDGTADGSRLGTPISSHANGENHFHRGPNGELTNTSFGNKRVYEAGMFRMGGEVVASPETTNYPVFPTFTVYSFRTSHLAQTQARRIARDRDFAGRFFDGWIAEMAIYNRRLSNIELWVVEAHMAARFGMPHSELLMIDDVMYNAADTMVVDFGTSGTPTAKDQIVLVADGADPLNPGNIELELYTDGTTTGDNAVVSGTLSLALSGLAAGDYDLYYLTNDGAGALAGPVNVPVTQPIDAPPVARGLFLHVSSQDIDASGDATGEPGDLTNVATWADLSGWGNDLTAAGGLQPLYVQSDANLNGNPTLLFDSSDDYFLPTFDKNNYHTGIFLVWEDKPFPTGDAHFAVLAGGDPEYGQPQHRGWSPEGALYQSTRPDDVANGFWRLDGTTYFAPDFYNTFYPDQFTIAAQQIVGDGVNFDRFGRDRGFGDRVWDGRMAEALLFDEILTIEEITEIEKWLAAKYGFALPSTVEPEFTIYGPADDIEVSFTNGNIANATDYIGIYTTGTVPTSSTAELKLFCDGSTVATTATDFGDVTFLANGLAPGEYQIWLMQDDGPTTLAGPAGIIVVAPVSDMPVLDNLRLHVTAFDVDASGDASGEPADGTTVSLWLDLSGKENNMWGTLNAAPMFVAGDPVNGGAPSMRFDGEDDHTTFPLVNNIRTAFVVLRNAPNRYDTQAALEGILSPAAGQNYFHRGSYSDSDVPIAYVSPTWGTEAVYNGVQREDGQVIDGKIETAANHLAVFMYGVTEDGASAEQLGRARDFTERYWTGDFCEVIIYTEPLDQAQIDQVEQYLFNKYAGSVFVHTTELEDGATFETPAYNQAETITVDFMNGDAATALNSQDRVVIVADGADPTVGGNILLSAFTDNGAGAAPTRGGTVTFPNHGLAAGAYDVYLLAQDGSTVKAGPDDFTVFTTLSPLPTLDGLIGHYDASDVNADGNSMTGEPSDMDSPTTWADLSGRGNDNWTTGPDPAVYLATNTDFNGLPAIEFNDDGIGYVSSNLMRIQTVIAVLAYDAGASFNGWDAIYSSNNPENDFFWGRNGTTTLGDDINTFWVNGAQTNQFAPLSASKIVIIESPDLEQALWEIGDGDDEWQGRIAELIVYNRSLSAQEQTDVGSYLSKKYGIITLYPIAPEITAAPTIQVQEGATLPSVKLADILDDNLSSITLTLSDASPLAITSATISVGGVLTGRVDATALTATSGTTVNVVITVEDENEAASDTLTIEIISPDNTSPTLTITRPFIVAGVGQAQTVTVGTVNDAEISSGSISTLLSGAPAELGAAVSNDDGLVRLELNPTAALDGQTFVLTIIANDGFVDVTGTLTVFVATESPTATREDWLFYE